MLSRRARVERDDPDRIVVNAEVERASGWKVRVMPERLEEGGAAIVIAGQDKVGNR